MGHLTLGLIACGLVLCGCTQSETSHDARRAEADELVRVARAASPDQYEILKDRQVTTTEMRGALDEYDRCLEPVGWQLESVFPNPAEGEPIFTYEVVPNTPASRPEDLDSCAHKTLQFVDQFAQTVQVQGDMDPTFLAGVAACLRHEGVNLPGGTRTSIDVFRAAKAKVDTVGACYESVYASAFPDRPELPVSPPAEVISELPKPEP